MNNDLNRNTRTLIVGFVFAIMVLVPLRFVEVSSTEGGQSVLGEQTVASVPRLEAPYDSLEKNQDCLTTDYVDKVITFLNREKALGVSKTNLVKIDGEIFKFEQKRCK